jgi:hypothetical protein
MMGQKRLQASKGGPVLQASKMEPSATGPPSDGQARRPRIAIGFDRQVRMPVGGGGGHGSDVPC